MDNFLTPLNCDILDDGRFIRVTREFQYYTYLTPKIDHPFINTIDDKTYFYIPIGFISDFASTPQILWSIAPPIGRFSKAAVVHDFLYRFNINNRKWADKVFLEAMTVSKTFILTRYIYYAKTRLLGWIAWLKWKRVLAKEAFKTT